MPRCLTRVGPASGCTFIPEHVACLPFLLSGALYYKSLSRGPAKPKSVDAAPNGEAAAESEKLPLVHATPAAPESAAAGAEQALK